MAVGRTAPPEATPGDTGPPSAARAPARAFRDVAAGQAALGGGGGGGGRVVIRELYAQPAGRTGR